MRAWTSFFLVLLLAPYGCSGSEPCECSGSASCACDAPPPCDTSVVGDVCTIAGNGENGYDADADVAAIPALKAKMSLPQDTLTAPDGAVYIIDWNNHRIRELGADGMLRWVAGQDELGGSLDDPAGTSFNHPTNIIFDATGQDLLIAAWHNNKIETIDVSDGTTVDTCGDGERAYFGDEGPALDASLDLPSSLALDPQGHLVLMDQENQVLRWVDGEGIIHRLGGQCVIDAPPPEGPGACSPGEAPQRCPDGQNGPSGRYACNDVTSCFLLCSPGYAGDDGPATEMRMAQPSGEAAIPAGRIVFDDDGDLYFTDTGNDLIRRIDASGVVHRVAGRPPASGVPQSGYSGDGGPAVDALLDGPVDLALGDDGTLYFSDVENHCVRAIDPEGIIRTVAGRCGQAGFGGDGGPATEALFKLPFGVEWADGRLNIADTGNNVIRSVRLR